jgi:hypothetical protein
VEILVASFANQTEASIPDIKVKELKFLTQTTAGGN